MRVLIAFLFFIFAGCASHSKSQDRTAGDEIKYNSDNINNDHNKESSIYLLTEAAVLFYIENESWPTMVNELFAVSDSEKIDQIEKEVSDLKLETLDNGKLEMKFSYNLPGAEAFNFVSFTIDLTDLE